MTSAIDTSGIDATKPTTTIAYTADVRANFAAIVTQIDVAGTEITALQGYFTGTPSLTDPAAWRTALGVDVAGTDNSTDVTLAGSYDYLTIVGQAITLAQIDLATDVTGSIPAASVPESAVTQHQAALSITESQISDLGAYLANVAEDTTPQLGGELDAQGNNITDLGDVTFKTGAGGGTLRTGVSAADKFELQAYEVDAATYRTVLELDAGNDVRLQMIADYLEIEDATDRTKTVGISLSGATASTETLLTFDQTASRVITFPDETGELLTDQAIGSSVQAYDAFLDDIAALVDPNADRILFWDDSAGSVVWLTVGTGLTITDTTLTASASSPALDDLTDVTITTVASGELLTYTGAGWENQTLAEAGIQPLDADLTAIAALTPTDGNIIVGNGSTWVAESGATARASLGVDAAGTDNSTDVTLAGTPDYITISGQVITRNAIDLAADVTGTLPAANGGTAQSTYASGDIIYASAANTLSKLAKGTDGHYLKLVSGLPAWAAVAGGSGLAGINIQTFTSSGTYTPTASYTWALIFAVGAGGGGGGADGNDTSSQAGGGGGGAGGLAIDAVDLSGVTTETVTIGAGGTAGADTGGDGGTGGTTSVGTLAVAAGGSGGQGVATGVCQLGVGGAGGSASAGDVQVDGNAGGVGWGDTSSNTVKSGPGAGSFFGGGAVGAAAGGTQTTAGTAGTKGGGGSGGACSNTTTGGAGGAGGDGFVMIIEFQ